MTAREIEAARRAMTRYVKRGGQVWIRVFPDVPITKKPLEVRMGSRQGQRRVLRRARAARQGAVRDGRRDRGDRARGVPPGGVASSRSTRCSSSGRCADEGEGTQAEEHAAELQDELLKLRREQFNLRMAQASGQAAKPDQFGKVRRNVARVKTVQGEQARPRPPTGVASDERAGNGCTATASQRRRAHADRHGRQQQDAEDHHGRGRAPGASTPRTASTCVARPSCWRTTRTASAARATWSTSPSAAACRAARRGAWCACVERAEPGLSRAAPRRQRP